MNDLLLYCVCAVVITTLVSGGLAIVWAKSRSPYRYVFSMALVWVGISMLLPWASTWKEATFPPDLAHFVATMYWCAPFILASAMGLFWSVRTGDSRNVILLASLVTSVVAVPFRVLSGIYAACSLGDCL
jgi:hypothetical protein